MLAKLKKEDIFYSLLSGYFLSCTFVTLLMGIDPIDLARAVDINLLYQCIVAVIFAIGFLFFAKYASSYIYLLVTFSTYVTAAIFTSKLFNFSLVLSSCAVIAIIVFYCRKRDEPEQIMEVITTKPARLWVYIAIGLIFVFSAYVLIKGVLMRFWSYNSSNFDLGIFAQMYEYMADTGIQNTTAERNMLLSHFAVHFSPIYYLLLPFYYIFRSVEFLLVAQVLIVLSGVVPFFLLCKKFGLSDKITFFASSAFLFFPAIAAPCFYDFHENAFLVPLLLWLMYSIEKNSNIGMIISTALLLCVKEDVGLYVIVIGIYALVSKKLSKRKSTLIILAGLLGLFLTISFLGAFGEGAKVNRYNNFLVDGQTELTSVVVNVLKSPAYFLSQLITNEKLTFLLMMFMPTLFVPLAPKKLSSFILLMPFLLINLASNYVYQFDINFQYVLGSATLILYLLAQNLSHLKTKLLLSIGTFAITAVMFISYIYVPKTEFYTKFYESNIEGYHETTQLLNSLPKDAVILANTYFIPQLYQHRQVYMYPCKNITPQYVVINTRDSQDSIEAIMATYEPLGYKVAETKGIAILLEKTP